MWFMAAAVRCCGGAWCSGAGEAMRRAPGLWSGARRRREVLELGVHVGEGLHDLRAQEQQDANDAHDDQREQDAVLGHRLALLLAKLDAGELNPVTEFHSVHLPSAAVGAETCKRVRRWSGASPLEARVHEAERGDDLRPEQNEDRDDADDDQGEQDAVLGHRLAVFATKRVAEADRSGRGVLGWRTSGAHSRTPCGSWRAASPD